MCENWRFLWRIPLKNHYFSAPYFFVLCQKGLCSRLQIRSEKIGNAGSFFKNPIISQTTLSKLQTSHPKIPFFAKNKEIKIPAAWLIEKCKWKGYIEKTCGVYNKHSLIIINRGNASGQEILKLANKIKKDIYKNFNIQLEEEVNIS